MKMKREDVRNIAMRCPCESLERLRWLTTAEAVRRIPGQPSSGDVFMDSNDIERERGIDPVKKYRCLL